MTYRIVLIISSFVLITGCQGLLESESKSWQIAREPEEDRIIRAIHFADYKYGWAVGDSGTIITTVDGGNSWNKSSSGTTGSLRTVFFINRQKGWIAGHATLLTTEDGGQSWRLLPLPIDTTHGITSIYFADEEMGWLVHTGGEVLSTQDGGETWESQLSWSSGGTSLFSFVNRTVGFVLPAMGALLWSTQDGGSYWSSSRFQGARWPTDMFFLNEQEGWICETQMLSCSYGVWAGVFHTADGGASWMRLATLDVMHVSAIQFIDENVGWLTSTSKIYKTTNGGRTWKCEYDSEAEGVWLGFQDLFFIDAAHGWALDFKGGICVYGTP